VEILDGLDNKLSKLEQCTDNVLVTANWSILPVVKSTDLLSPETDAANLSTRMGDSTRSSIQEIDNVDLSEHVDLTSLYLGDTFDSSLAYVADATDFRLAPRLRPCIPTTTDIFPIITTSVVSSPEMIDFLLLFALDAIWSC